jgi:hypothetical protein
MQGFMEKILQASPQFNKRDPRRRCGLSALLVLSAGHGGEGEEIRAAMMSAAARYAWVPSESAVPAAVPKRRRGVASAILGQKDGPAELEISFSGMFFLLCWRIFSHLSAAANAGASPSGLVPGGTTGAHVWRSKFDDGYARLDCVSAIFFRVFTANFRYFVVFFLFLEVPAVNVHPTPV